MAGQRNGIFLTDNLIDTLFVPDGARVTIYEHGNFGGYSKTFTQSGWVNLRNETMGWVYPGDPLTFFLNYPHWANSNRYDLNTGHFLDNWYSLYRHNDGYVSSFKIEGWASADITETFYDYRYDWTSKSDSISDQRQTLRFQYVSTAEDVYGDRPKYETFNTQVKVVDEKVVTQWKTELITQEQVLFVTSRTFEDGALRDFGTFGSDSLSAAGNITLETGGDVFLSGLFNGFGSDSSFTANVGGDFALIGSLPNQCQRSCKYIACTVTDYGKQQG